MNTRRNVRFEDWEAKRMKDPEFRAAIEEFEPTYQADRLRIMQRLTQEQTVCEWVSVDETLPEVGTRVIGALPVDEDCWMIEVGKFMSPQDFGGLAVIDNGHQGWSWISHWMPLPNPPPDQEKGGQVKLIASTSCR